MTKRVNYSTFNVASQVATVFCIFYEQLVQFSKKSGRIGWISGEEDDDEGLQHVKDRTCFNVMDNALSLK